MKWAPRDAVVFCILLGSICPACMATDPELASQNTAAGHILAEQTTTDLFNALDRARPDLGSVAVAWKRNDQALAKRELAQYFRKRTSVGWKTQAEAIPQQSPQSRAVADGAVEGRLQGGLVPLVYSFPDGKIDWHFNATDHKPGEAHNDEWQWQLNRMSFWADLAVAYRVTGDERYAEAFVEELRSWIVQCPVPDHTDNGSGSSWRTIEAGIRSGGSWIDAFYAFRNSPAMSDEDLLTLVHSLLDHARYLRSHHTRLNWLTLELSGLYAVGAVFPEFKDAGEWRSYAGTTLAEEGRKQFLPDGAQAELSTGYQNVAIDSILNIAEIARFTGTAKELPVDFFAPLEKAYEWQVKIVAPDRYLPKVNDSWPAYLPAILKKAVLYFPSDPEFQWFVSKGRAGAPPPATSVFLNRSGLAAMRSSWNTDANYLLFRVGPLGMGHQHQDSLGVNVWAYGRELIFNGGGGSYEKSKWRQWAVSAFAHNTVVVDDMAQTRTTSQDDPFHDPDMISQGPIDAHWQTNPAFDFASGVYAEGYGPSHKKIASQQRNVLFLKPDLYVVADRVKPNDALPHRFQARWQILTTHSRKDPSTQSLVTEDAGLSNISVVPLLVDGLRVESVSGQEEPEILGWNVRKDAVPQLVPATTLLQTVTGSGPHLLLTLLIPLRPGEANPITRVEPGKDGVSATAIFTDGRRLLISCPGPRGISAQETLLNGKAGRSATGGKL